MQKELEMTLRPEQAFDEDVLQKILLSKFHIPEDEPHAHVRVLRRSIDARGKTVKVRLRTKAFLGEEEPPLITYQPKVGKIGDDRRVVIVGAGPAGLFAAIRLLEDGIKPIIFERGKDVRARRRDLAALNKDHVVDPDSNYCFGEGGAGTYSDGKLYTRSKKRGDILRILEILVHFGAKEDILIDAHPHIGTNKLPKIIQAMREFILESGGEIRFETRMTDLILQNGSVRGIVTREGERVEGEAVILATGHSARDVFEILQHQHIAFSAKPFALGVRVEHPQQLIDQIQYHCEHRGDYLPAAAYSLVRQTHVQGAQRGVFSFCMCPGGFIVPAATSPGEVVVNGMSPSRRNSRYANSGIVVEIDPEIFQSEDPLSGVKFQASIEQKACQLAGGDQTAPAQRLVDFVNRKVSSSLPPTSYQPGLASVAMDEVLPETIAEPLRKAFRAFGKKMRGFLTNDAQIVGVESRTSCPITIPRDPVTTEHTEVKGLYPCGEGAGYAGGIVSAAMDGERVAIQLSRLVV